MKRVLVADDNPVMAELISAHLKNIGYAEIDVARDGSEASRLINNKMYSLIILDRYMPGMSGLEVVRDMKFVVPPVAAPVMIVTASPDKEMMDTIRRESLPVSAIIAKPFSLATFESKHHQLRHRIRHVEDDVRPADSEDKEETAKQYAGKDMKMRMVQEDGFFGIVISGQANRANMILIKKAFDAAIASSSQIVAVSIVDVDKFDEFFIGFFLLFAGTLGSVRRQAVLITGGNQRLAELGIDRIITSYAENQDFYREIGYGESDELALF
ncbi:hypothetical protein CCP1ISM_80006 [Azospirillaceae bacterium]